MNTFRRADQTRLRDHQERLRALSRTLYSQRQDAEELLETIKRLQNEIEQSFDEVSMELHYIDLCEQGEAEYVDTLSTKAVIRDAAHAIAACSRAFSTGGAL